MRRPKLSPVSIGHLKKLPNNLGCSRGYRILANTGADAHQEVMHYHLHIFAGCDLGSMIKRGLV